MLDFKAELDKLLSMETEPLPDKGDELAEVLLSFGKKQTDISMQVEEIYDIVKDADDSAAREELRSERKRAVRLVNAVMGLCDIIEDFHVYAARNADEALAGQALMMWRNTEKMLEECGMSRINGYGETGERFNPEIHKVQAVSPSVYPREHVTRVLRSGYRHMGEVARKAVVVVSAGKGENDEQNNRH